MREKEVSKRRKVMKIKQKCLHRRSEKRRKAFGPFELVTEYAVDHKVDTAVECYLDDLQM